MLTWNWSRYPDSFLFRLYVEVSTYLYNDTTSIVLNYLFLK